MKSKLDRFKFPQVKDIMQREVIAFTPEHSIFDVLKSFNERRISSAPVLETEKSQNIIGFVTETDCLKYLGNAAFYHDEKEVYVKSIMSNNVTLVHEDSDIFELEQLFQSKHLKHAPVVDRENHLVGIVGMRDILIGLENIFTEMEHYKEGLKGPLTLSMIQEAKLKLS